MDEDLTVYERKPEGFLLYLMYNGEHFNKKLCEFACKLLGNYTYQKDSLDSMLKSNNIEVPKARLYDSVYVANWCRSVYYGSSIPDDKHLLMFIKNTFEKEGNLVFNRWYADMSKKGIPIDWDAMI